MIVGMGRSFILWTKRFPKHTSLICFLISVRQDIFKLLGVLAASSNRSIKSWSPLLANRYLRTYRISWFDTPAIIRSFGTSRVLYFRAQNKGVNCVLAGYLGPSRLLPFVMRYFIIPELTLYIMAVSKGVWWYISVLFTLAPLQMRYSTKSGILWRAATHKAVCPIWSVASMSAPLLIRATTPSKKCILQAVITGGSILLW